MHAAHSSARDQRDEAIQRVGLTRRVVIGGAAALTAGIAAFVSAIAPGRTLGASRVSKAAVPSARAPAAASTATPKMPPLQTASQLGLVAGSAPQPAPSQPSPPPVQQQSVQPQPQAPVQQAPVQQAPPVVVSGGS